MDELKGVTKEMWEAAEKVLEINEEQKKKLFDNLLLFGTAGYKCDEDGLETFVELID